MKSVVTTPITTSRGPDPLTLSEACVYQWMCGCAERKGDWEGREERRVNIYIQRNSNLGKPEYFNYPREDRSFEKPFQLSKSILESSWASEYVYRDREREVNRQRDYRVKEDRGDCNLFFDLGLERGGWQRLAVGQLKKAIINTNVLLLAGSLEDLYPDWEHLIFYCRPGGFVRDHRLPELG